MTRHHNIPWLVTWCLPLLSFLLSGCSHPSTPDKEEGDTIRLRYSTLLTMVRHPHYTEVTIADPWHKGRILQRLRIEKVFRRALVFTSPHCRLMEDLRCDESIAGVCDARYINSPDIRRRLSGRDVSAKTSSIVDCGNAMSPDIERIVALKPDIIIMSPYDGGSTMATYNNPATITLLAADYMEPSPLARAEWMKLYGLLFGCSEVADSLFRYVEKSYLSLKTKAIKLPKGRSILTERKTGATWYCPGGRSTVAQLIADANGGYAFADDTHSGSLALPSEQVLAKAGNSDIWAFKHNTPQPLTRRQLLDEYYGYNALKAMRTGNVYQCDATATAFFDETPFRPDLLLCEFIILLHPEADFGQLRYYKKSLLP